MSARAVLAYSHFTIVYETAYDGQLALMLAARLPLRT